MNLNDQLDEEWMNFNENGNFELNNKSSNNKLMNDIKCSDIYISTKTKIGYLNLTSIDLNDLFWKLPILDYHIPKNGILKKSFKINCNSKEEVVELENKIKSNVNVKETIITQIDNMHNKRHKFKDIRKIDMGLCKSDLLSCRKKKKGAFYNCFAIIMRIMFKNVFKEVHIKIFNTGKLEIPGIQDDQLLYNALDELIKILKNIINKDNIYYKKDKIENVLINSNFNCGYFIDRTKLYNLLKYEYKIHSLYDPCSYPGIQCKFYYNKSNHKNNGICCCSNKCYNISKKDKKLIKDACIEISFMIFRTGSVLIVGHCDVDTLMIVYNYLKNILTKEYLNIYQPGIFEKKIKNKVNKIRKKTILFTA